MRYLTQAGARSLLKKYGIAMPYGKLVGSRADALKFASKARYPVILKVMSPDIPHKTDAMAVMMAHNAGELSRNFERILYNAKKYAPGARIDGVLVERCVHGTELIVGVKKDPQFGPVVLFGLGGIFVEAMKDVAIRLAPLSKKDASDMIREIRGYSILCGWRGSPPVDILSVEKAILSVSEMVSDHPEIAELDINPLFADEKGAIAADARIAIE